MSRRCLRCGKKELEVRIAWLTPPHYPGGYRKRCFDRMAANASSRDGYRSKTSFRSVSSIGLIVAGAPATTANPPDSPDRLLAVARTNRSLAVARSRRPADARKVTSVRSMTQSRRIVSEHIDDGFLELWRSNHVDLAA